jgi:hypothetical protein
MIQRLEEFPAAALGSGNDVLEQSHVGSLPTGGAKLSRYRS